MLVAPLTATAMNAVPKASAGMASSMLNIIQQVGGSIGIALLSLILHRRSVFHLNHMGSDITGESPAFQQAAMNIASRAHDLGYTHAQSGKIASSFLGSELGKLASVVGFQDAFLVGSLLTFVTTILVFLLPSKPIIHKSAEPVHLE